MDKLLRWRAMAEKFYGNDFWSWIFDNSNASNKDSFSVFDEGEPEKKENKFPLIDIYVSNNELIILVELPGLSKDDVELGMTEDKMKIKGTFKNMSNSNTTNILRERYSGPFERIVKLPEVVKEDKATAKFLNGVLQVRVPRKETFQSRQIKID